MKILNTLLCTIGILFLFSCQSTPSENKISTKEITIPQLLDRNEKLYHGKEWETVQNDYVHARENLGNQKTQAENYLKLASLFINEARITGEHGHYYPAALEVLNRALETPKSEDINFRAMAMKASVLLSQHEFQEALELGEKALELNPYNSHIYGVLVDAYVELGDYPAAILMADKMINIRPDLRSYARVSYLREIHGDVKGAKKAMKLAVDAGYPSLEQTAWTQLTLGELFQTYGDLKNANIIYNNILTQRHNYPFAIAAIADIEMKNGNLDSAEALLEKAIDIIPEVGFYIQLAHLYKKTNRLEEFEKIIPEIFEMLEDDVVHGHNMNLEYASLYLELLGKNEKALEFAQKEYSKRPQNIDVNRLLAQIHFAKSDYSKAAKHATIAERTGSVHPDLLQVKTMLTSN